MAITSGEQCNNINGNYRCWLDETFDQQETADGEVSYNLDGNGCQMQLSMSNADPFEPFVGMEFETAEDAREFYEMYGRRVGFTIRNNRIRRSVKDNSIIGREFVCSKEGSRAGKCIKRENIAFPSISSTREGCSAMLRIASKGDGKWVIYCFVEQHNHELNPSAIPPRRSHRIAYNEDEKDLKIRELSIELHRERKKSAAYQEQLEMVLKCIEEHTQRLSLEVKAAASKINELESEEPDSSES